MALGIDEYKTEQYEFRSWEGLRIFFSKKPKELEELSQMNVKMSSLDWL